MPCRQGCSLYSPVSLPGHRPRCPGTVVTSTSSTPGTSTQGTRSRAKGGPCGREMGSFPECCQQQESRGWRRAPLAAGSSGALLLLLLSAEGLECLRITRVLS